ncbi:hypothetical protein EON65_34900 [archaeon]|nr:MAG: hypothetical protein EON65_34900 [archaeon]
MRQHLQENKKELYNVTDKLTEGDKKDTAQLLQRFAHGYYGGVPSSQEEGEEKERGRFWVVLGRIVGLMVVVGMLYFLALYLS